MWLLPHVSRLAGAAGRIFYRLDAAGGRVPRAGPALLVANHPNGLVDPVLVASAARRPVRFLGKAPLFEDWRIGWLMRGVGAIPVYRRQDDPTALNRNVEMFAAVEAALASGAAVALFPEGISHDAPALAPLRTGAARIALGAAAALGASFPVIPVGIVLRQKETFRSEALVVIGGAIAWDDLASRGADDQAATRLLTDRIADGLRDVTLNLERWEDRPLVETAEAVYAVELGADDDPGERVERLRLASELLEQVRRDDAPAWASLERAVGRHCRALDRLGLTAEDLHVDLSTDAVLGWTLKRLPLVLLPVVLLAAAGAIVWWPPYRATGLAADALRPTRDVRATYKLFGGLVFHGLWLVGSRWRPWRWAGCRSRSAPCWSCRCSAWSSSGCASAGPPPGSTRAASSSSAAIPISGASCAASSASSPSGSTCSCARGRARKA
jgi:1-acyl-sn-glycerol-3-phosphate acyltransferase